MRRRAVVASFGTFIEAATAATELPIFARISRSERRADVRLFLQLPLQCANESREAYLPFALELLGAQDRFDGFEGDTDIVVDDNIVVSIEMAHFVARLLHAATDDFVRILRTGVQTLFERLRRWRQDEHADDVAGRAAA